MTRRSWAVTLLAFLLAGCAGSCRPTARAERQDSAQTTITPAEPALASGTTPSIEANDSGTRPNLAANTDAGPGREVFAGLGDASHLSVAQLGAGAARGAGVVTSVEAQATNVGVAILEAGGNAVDAAVATAFALAVTHPSAGNLGGGGFALIVDGQTVDAIDFREDSPSGLTRPVFDKMIEGGGRGPLSVGVPGTVAGLELMHRRHGHLPWKDLLHGAIRLAKEGQRCGLRQSQTLHWARRGLLQDPVARATFFPQGQPLAAGTRVRQPKLGSALERIAQQGSAGFYQGETAEDLVDSLEARLAATTSPDVDQQRRALMTLGDLAKYRAKVRSPLIFDYHGARVVTMPPPSAGGATLLLNLAMLDALDVQKTAPGSVERYHLLIEASRRAQVERRLLLSAPERMVESHDELLKRFTDAETWLEDHPVEPGRATRSSSLHPLYEESLLELEHTTHLSVVDESGQAVSLTVTLSGSFGAQIMSEQTGIVLNNSVASFGSVGRNVPAAGVRTTSSMAPSLVLLSPNDFLVLGSPGGDTIPSTITQLTVALIDDGLSLSEAVLAPRIHQGFVPDEVSMERLRPLSAKVRDGLTHLGHTVRPSRSTIGDANIAARVAGQALAVYDPREGGLAKSVERRRPSPSNIKAESASGGDAAGTVSAGTPPPSSH